MDYRRKFSAYASRPDARRMLFGVSFLEALCVPLPSDFLLIPMALLAPDRAFKYAVIAGLGSALGATVAYALAALLFVLLSGFIADYSWVQNALAIFQSYSGIFIVAAGFSAVPFNVVTFLSGFAGVNVMLFVALTSGVRILRYGIISWLIWRGGSRYQEWLERNYYGLMLVMTLGLLVISAIGILLFETA